MTNITLNIRISLVTDDDLAAFDRMVGWKAMLTIPSSGQQVPNADTREDAFYGWAGEKIAEGLNESARAMAVENATVNLLINEISN